MPKEMEGKNALVTGASAGIGRSVALLFAEKGAKVIVADVKSQQAQETVQLIEKVGSEAVFVKTDVSRSTEVEALIDKAVRTYGQLDYACNNAGIDGVLAPTAECTEENWDLVMNINLKGVWLCMKYEIMQTLKQGAGAIVNTASVVGVVGIQGLPAY